VQFNTGYTGGSLTVKGQTVCGVQGTAKSQALTHTGCATGTKLTLPVSSHISNDYFIYPNPSKGKFTISSKNAMTVSEACKMEILNRYGQVVARFEKTLINGQVQIDLEKMHLPDGLYILQYQSEVESKSLRLILQR
jgi:hypothetical protein